MWFARISVVTEAQVDNHSTLERHVWLEPDARVTIYSQSHRVRHDCHRMLYPILARCHTQRRQVRGALTVQTLHLVELQKRCMS